MFRRVVSIFGGTAKSIPPPPPPCRPNLLGGNPSDCPIMESVASCIAARKRSLLWQRVLFERRLESIVMDIFFVSSAEGEGEGGREGGVGVRFEGGGF